MNESFSLDSIYQEILMDHSSSPRNFEKLEKCDIQAEGFNPLCGDQVTLQIVLDSRKKEIKEIKFQGEGCSICMASSSMMTESLQNKSLSESLKIIEDFRGLMQDKVSADVFENEDLTSLSGVKRFPVRIKCALLPWTTLSEPIKNQIKKGENS